MSTKSRKTTKKTTSNNKNKAVKKKGVAAFVPFLVLAVSLLAETCLVLGGDSGASGGVRKLFTGLFGYGAHVLLVGAMLIAFFYGELTQRGTLRFKSLAVSGLTVLVSAILTLVSGNADAVNLSLSQLWTNGALGQGGGVIGGLLGILFALALTPAFAVFICTVCVLALASFTFGKTRLGIWSRIFGGAEPKKEAKKEAPAPAPALEIEVSPSRVDTILGEDEGISYPELTSGSDAPDMLGGGFSVTDGRHTIETVDFEASERPATPHTPEDLMDKLGLKKAEPQKTDIYSEASKKPTPSGSKINLGNTNAYSPFTLPKAAQNGTYTPPPTPSKNEGTAYSPFSDPVRSMHELRQAGIPAQGEDEAQIVENMQKQAEDIGGRADQSIQSARSSSFGIPDYEAPKKEAPVFDMPVYEAPKKEAPVFDTTVYEAQKTEEPIYEETKTESDVFENPVFESAADGEAEYADLTAEPEPPAPVYTPPRVKPQPVKAVSEPEEDEDDHSINPFGIYNKLRYPRFKLPPTDLLDPADKTVGISENEIYETQRKLITTLENFGISATLTGYCVGPTITRYELAPGPGVKFKQIANLSEDISVHLQSDTLKSGIRIVTVPGKSVVGVEVPNSVVKKVALRSMIEEDSFRNAKSKINVCLGMSISGKPVYMNIDDMPHVLVAGQTKSGKSVAINCMIMSLIYRATPDEVQLLLVDPKRVELSIYNNLPHLIMPVIDEPNKAAAALKWAVDEMDRRYKLLNDAQVRNREEYYACKNDNPDFEYMPQIVIIIDELADLMLQAKEHVEGRINRLAAMARACGMHIVIGTQRPSTDILTGVIKANIPSQVAFKVASQIDSRVILNSIGAEKLLGRGDMLYHETGKDIVRLQGAYVDTHEIKKVLKYIMDNNGKAVYNPEIMYALQQETDKLNKVDKKAVQSDDYAVDGSDPDFELLCQAAELVIQMGGGISKNVIQRHLKIGFNRSANIFDKLEELGFISPPQGNKPRDCTVTWEQYQQWKSNNGK